MSKPLKKKRPSLRTGPQKLRHVPIGEGLPPIPNMSAELEDMLDVLTGRQPPPINVGTLNLMEIADAYFARGMEMTMLLQKGEREGRIARGSAHYKFRTGELRTFCEIAKKASELGSRRLTSNVLRFDQERYGRDSAGDVDD